MAETLSGSGSLHSVYLWPLSIPIIMHPLCSENSEDGPPRSLSESPRRRLHLCSVSMSPWDWPPILCSAKESNRM